MKTMMAGAALAAALCALSGAALAQTTTQHGSMAGEHGAMSGHMAPATMICRPASGSEHGNAMMAASHAMLMCKTLAAGMADGKTGPDLSKALTPGDVNAAWQRWVSAQLDIPVTGGG